MVQSRSKIATGVGSTSRAAANASAPSGEAADPLTTTPASRSATRRLQAPGHYVSLRTAARQHGRTGPAAREGRRAGAARVRPLTVRTSPAGGTAIRTAADPVGKTRGRGKAPADTTDPSSPPAARRSAPATRSL